MDLTKLYEKQISLTEWFQSAGHADSEALRQEDNAKRERLRVLHELIGLPFDAPMQFTANDVTQQTPTFLDYLEHHGNELCALRLIPTADPSLPKLRMRGYTVRDVLKWFHEQKIDPTKYTADFVPHPKDHIWSTIFVVNDNGMYGEIISGSHHQLTQGFHDESHPIRFGYNFSRWQLAPHDSDAETHLKEILSSLAVSIPSMQVRLQEELQAQFAGAYLKGYFETVSSKEFGLWFIDYNRILGDWYKDFHFQLPLNSTSTANGLLYGQTGSPGKTTGTVRIVLTEAIETATISDTDILVCTMTTPAYLPLMAKAKAVVTDWGGILTHAAIVCRELKKPCVVGTKMATQVLKNGDYIIVDADQGTVNIVL